MIGIVTTTAAAAIEPVGSVKVDSPVKKASAAGTVREASDEVSEIAKTKSFQQKMKTRIAAVKTPGAASGRITLRKAWNGRGAVDLGGLLEVPGDLAEEGDEDVDRQRQARRSGRG